MRRTLLLLLAGSLVIFGCNVDDNPVSSSSRDDQLVGRWLDEDGDYYTFTDDGEFIDEMGDEYSWSTNGDKLVFGAGDGYYGTYSYQVTDDKLTITDPDEDFQIGNPAIFRRTDSSNADSEE